MKVAQLTYTDAGGAGRAAVRLHRALRSHDTASSLIVARKRSDEPGVVGRGQLGNLASKIRSTLGQNMMRLQLSADAGVRSPAVLPSRVPEQVAQMNPDIVHLHWINGEVLTPADITRFQVPLVWTMHDMWAFCGTEHYAETDRWVTGYTKANRPIAERGIDLDRLTWRSKLRAWTKPIQIICPSRWMAECVSASALMRTWPVTVIPNAIDTETWRPVEKAEARARLGLRPEGPLVLFGAIGGTQDHRKGGDLLVAAIKKLVAQVPDVNLAVFGQSEGPDLGAPTQYLGNLAIDQDLICAYSAADVIALPSRQDNLPNTGLEALSCGTPIAAFQIGGMNDIVHHRKTGYLAEAFSPEDLAKGLSWLLSDAERRADLSHKAVIDARSKFSATVIAKKHIELYDDLLSEVN